jgi:hypothetical protein
MLGSPLRMHAERRNDAAEGRVGPAQPDRLDQRKLLAYILILKSGNGVCDQDLQEQSPRRPVVEWQDVKDRQEDA